MNVNPRILVVIPARYYSTRFPGKPLVDILGTSMIMRCYNAVRKAKKIEDVIVATDSDLIYEHLIEQEAKVIMTSPHHENGTERVAEVASMFQGFDYIINVQGDEPCISPIQVDELADFLIQGDFDICTQAKRISKKSVWDDKNAVKVVFDDNGKSISFRRDRLLKHLQHLNKGKHIGIYGFKRELLVELVKLSRTQSEIEQSLEQLRWMENGYSIGVRYTLYHSPSVDVPEDLENVISFLKKNK